MQKVFSHQAVVSDQWLVVSKINMLREAHRVVDSVHKLLQWPHQERVYFRAKVREDSLKWLWRCQTVMRGWWFGIRTSKVLSIML
ncbi:hypothetical protein [Desulfonatronum parangueonense]